MKTQLSSFVVHWIVEDPDGLIRSRKHPEAAAFESAMARCPGVAKHTLGNPGKRYALACSKTQKMDGLVHRGSTDERMVNCPGCYKILQARMESAHA